MYGSGDPAYASKRLIPKIGMPAVFAIACCAAVFFLRSPVVVVSDTSFELLYGEKRSLFERRVLSGRTFRPVRLALVSEGSAPVSAADVAQAASEGGKAACVIFPARYSAGAEAFRSRFPAANTVVVGDSSAGVGGPGQIYLSVDRETDLYRAGRITGVIAEGRTPALRMGAAETADLADAFSRGLSDERYGIAPLLLDSAVAARPGGASLVLTDAGSESGGSPATLAFSWSDPAFLPKDILVVFDDSPCAFLFEAYRAGMRRVSTAAASAVRVVGMHKIPARTLFAIQAAARARRH